MCENSSLDKKNMLGNMKKKKILIVCTTDSMIWNFLIPHIEFLISKGYIVECVCSRTGFYFDDIKKNKINIHEVNFSRQPLTNKNIKGIKELIRIVKNNQFDLIFCHEPVGGLAGRICGFITKTKVVYMAHGFHFYKNAPKINWCIYYPVELFLSFFTDAIITINQEDYKRSKKMFSKKVFFLDGIGINTSKFNKTLSSEEIYEIRKDMNLLDKKIVIAVGELIKRKNQETLINTIKLMSEDFVLIICGDGELKEYYDELIKKLNLSSRIHLLGYRKDINKLCQISDIFCMPSYQEGLSVALMEAMSIGIPIVASKIRGNIDLIDDKKGGRLVNTEDVAGYKLAFEDVLKNKESYTSYSKEKIKQYDINKIKNDLFKIIEEEL